MDLNQDFGALCLTLGLEYSHGNNTDLVLASQLLTHSLCLWSRCGRTYTDLPIISWLPVKSPSRCSRKFRGITWLKLWMRTYDWYRCHLRTPHPGCHKALCILHLSWFYCLSFSMATSLFSAFVISLLGSPSSVLSPQIYSLLGSYSDFSRKYIRCMTYLCWKS